MFSIAYAQRNKIIHATLLCSGHQTLEIHDVFVTLVFPGAMLVPTWAPNNLANMRQHVGIHDVLRWEDKT